jgi:hypothetical protein
MRSIVESFKYLVALQSATVTGSGVGVIIDRRGYESVTFAVLTGAVSTADGSNTLTVSLTASNDAAMAGEEVVTADNGLVGANLVVNATADANKVGAFGYNGDKRYLRIAVTEVGTASAVLAAVALLGHGLVRPEVGHLDLA